jgi:hypothetical protein
MYGVLRLVESVDVLPHDMCQFYLDHALRNISVTVRLESSHTNIYSCSNIFFKGSVRPDWIYMRVVPFWIVEKDINRYRFLTF